jgi:hypothetical protein
MKNNLNMGLDTIAKTYIKLKADLNVKPVICGRTGNLKSIKLNRYELKDGTFAYEYLQMILENNKGQNLYFLGLKTDNRSFDWPAEKMLKKIK